MFPCAPDSKKPATEHGFHDATTDLEQIDRWWTAEPRYNIARCPHQTNEAVIDLDGEAGEASWDTWQIEHGYLPLTYTIKTPRGGRHLYYRGILPPTQSKLGVHVDTRGVGSYALVPPSVVSGKPYVVVDSRPAADLGETVGDFLAGLQKDHVKAAVADLDLPQNVGRAKVYLRDCVAAGRVALQGQMGDGTTYAVACEVMNLGISAELAFDLMWELWAPHCTPFDERFENFLRVKIENAARYAQNEAGAWAVESSAEVFGSALDSLTPEEREPSTAEPKKRRFKRWSLAEMLALPPPAWLLPDLLPDKGVSLLYGPPGTFKTYLAVYWACQLASLGTPVLYCAGEGSIGVSQRIRAWCMLHDIDPASLPLEIIRAAPWADDGAMIQEFIEDELKVFKPALVVMDTLARSAVGLDENSAKDMGKIVNLMDAIRVAGDCSVLVIHHSGKDEARGARGSGSLTAGVDAAFEIKRPSKSVKAVAVYCKRQKDAEERTTPWTFEGKTVGDQMVFQPISVAEFHTLTSTHPRVEPIEIGRALRSLGAIGPDAGVSTDVLAQKLAELNSESPEQEDAAKAGYATVLGKGAGGVFSAYCEGSPPKWYTQPRKEA